MQQLPPLRYTLPRPPQRSAIMNPRKNPVVFPPKRTGRRAGRRGFTLVEIALAMAVIGLLLGATVITSRALEERRQIKMEMERLQRVSDAIVGLRPAEPDAGARH